jgi:hypothetical protein
MKKLLLPILVSLILASSFSNAAIDSYDERFTLFCEIEGSTGFNWVNGNWKQTNFKAGKKYIIKKHDAVLPVVDGFAPLGTKNPLCAHSQKEPNDGWLSTRNGCYSVKEFGEESHPLDAKTCYETWRTNEQGIYAVDEVECPYHFPNIEFKPNGLIHLFNSGGLNADPKELIVDGVKVFPAGYKDSWYIAFGRCSTI